MKGEHIFTSLVDIPSYPEEFLGLRDNMHFLAQKPGFIFVCMQIKNLGNTSTLGRPRNKFRPTTTLGYLFFLK